MSASDDMCVSRVKSLETLTLLVKSIIDTLFFFSQGKTNNPHFLQAIGYRIVQVGRLTHAATSLREELSLENLLLLMLSLLLSLDRSLASNALIEFTQIISWTSRACITCIYIIRSTTTVILMHPSTTVITSAGDYGRMFVSLPPYMEVSCHVAPRRCYPLLVRVTGVFLDHGKEMIPLHRFVAICIKANVQALFLDLRPPFAR